MTDRRAVAEQLIESMGNYPGVGEHFREEWRAYYKQDIDLLVKALADAERRVWETVEDYVSEEADFHFENGNALGRLALEAIEQWAHAQAQADKEAPHGTDTK